MTHRTRRGNAAACASPQPMTQLQQSCRGRLVSPLSLPPCRFRRAWTCNQLRNVSWRTVASASTYPAHANATGSLSIRTCSSTSPSRFWRTITDRRRCRSMPTYCCPSYDEDIGASSLEMVNGSQPRVSNTRTVNRTGGPVPSLHHRPHSMKALRGIGQCCVASKRMSNTGTFKSCRAHPPEAPSGCIPPTTAGPSSPAGSPSVRVAGRRQRRTRPAPLGSSRGPRCRRPAAGSERGRSRRPAGGRGWRRSRQRRSVSSRGLGARRSATG